LGYLQRKSTGTPAREGYRRMSRTKNKGKTEVRDHRKGTSQHGIACEVEKSIEGTHVDPSSLRGVGKNFKPERGLSRSSVY